ncbi:hypothetical protein UT300019_19650 [Clostridium sp. CTA-19]
MKMLKENFNIKKATITELLNYYKPETINNYCKKCEKYNKVWSCPTFSFDTMNYINNYEFAYIIAYRININAQSNIENDFNSIKRLIPEVTEYNDDFDKIFKTLYYSARFHLDKLLLSLEKEFQSSLAIFSGRCLFCKVCQKEYGLKCLNETNLKYSLEALGFDVADILKSLLNIEIQWSKESSSQYVTCVSALFSKEEIDISNLNKSISNIIE